MNHLDSFPPYAHQLITEIQAIKAEIDDRDNEDIEPEDDEDPEEHMNRLWDEQKIEYENHPKVQEIRDFFALPVENLIDTYLSNPSQLSAELRDRIIYECTPALRQYLEDKLPKDDPLLQTLHKNQQAGKILL